MFPIEMMQAWGSDATCFTCRCPDNNIFGKYVYLPVVEHRQSKGLSLCMSAKICLKAKRVDGRDESLNGVERRPWNRCILRDMTPR